MGDDLPGDYPVEELTDCTELLGCVGIWVILNILFVLLHVLLRVFVLRSAPQGNGDVIAGHIGIFWIGEFLLIGVFVVDKWLARLDEDGGTGFYIGGFWVLAAVFMVLVERVAVKIDQWLGY